MVKQGTVIGIPYVSSTFEGRKEFITCPECGLKIEQRKRKDAESHSHAEFAEHFLSAHPDSPKIRRSNP